MVNRCENCEYYHKTAEQSLCYYNPESPNKINDDAIPCSLFPGNKAVFDDPYPNESYVDWCIRLNVYREKSSEGKRIYIKAMKEKEPEIPKHIPSRFDDII